MTRCTGEAPGQRSFRVHRGLASKLLTPTRQSRFPGASNHQHAGVILGGSSRSRLAGGDSAAWLSLRLAAEAARSWR